jgi:hypothetical protein
LWREARQKFSPEEVRTSEEMVARVMAGVVSLLQVFFTYYDAHL